MWAIWSEGAIAIPLHVRQSLYVCMELEGYDLAEMSLPKKRKQEKLWA